MIYVIIPPDDLEKINSERFRCHDPIVARHLHALFFKSLDLPHQQICNFVDISPPTLVEVLKKYARGGLKEIMQTNWKPKRAILDDHREIIEQLFRKHPPESVKVAANEIEKLTGIKRGKTQIRNFLHKIGMEPRKVAGIPAKADPIKQEEFKKKSLEPALEEAKNGDAAVYFIDSAHFVMGAFLAMLWSFTRIFIKTSSGRQRFNVLGALNAVTLQMVTVVNDSYINAWSVAELFKKLRELHPGKKITLLLDNAKYQKCYVVKSAASMLRINLLYLPPYSPNLNLIERVWKFIRKKRLNCKYYETFDEFKLAILGCIAKFGGEYKAELESLLTWTFQTFPINEIEEKVA